MDLFLRVLIVKNQFKVIRKLGYLNYIKQAVLRKTLLSSLDIFESDTWQRTLEVPAAAMVEASTVAVATVATVAVADEAMVMVATIMAAVEPIGTTEASSRAHHLSSLLRPATSTISTQTGNVFNYMPSSPSHIYRISSPIVHFITR
jgi:hypothetical protein